MPNRILKESICVSEDVDGLSSEAEILMYRLIVAVDDYGRFDGRPSVIRARCFPLRLDSVTDHAIAELLDELEDRTVLERYEIGGRPYIRFKAWDQHQQVRAKRSKFPGPEGIREHLISSDSKSPRESESLSESKEHPLFERFYKAFPRHAGRLTAIGAFARAVKRAPADEIIAGAERLRDDPNLPEKRYVPHPTTWLNRNGWEDEPLPPLGNNGKPPEPVPSYDSDAAARRAAQMAAEDD